MSGEDQTPNSGVTTACPRESETTSASSAGAVALATQAPAKTHRLQPNTAVDIEAREEFTQQFVDQVFSLGGPSGSVIGLAPHARRTRPEMQVRCLATAIASTTTAIPKEARVWP